MTTDQTQAEAPPADAPAAEAADEMVVVIPASVPSTEPQHLGSGEQVPGLYTPGEEVPLSTLATRMGLTVEEARPRLVTMGILPETAGDELVPNDVRILAPAPPPVLATLQLPEGASDAREPGEAISQALADDPAIVRQSAPDMVAEGAWVAEALPGSTTTLPAEPPPVDPNSPDQPQVSLALDDRASAAAPATPPAPPAPTDTTTTTAAPAATTDQAPTPTATPPPPSAVGAATSEPTKEA